LLKNTLVSNKTMSTKPLYNAQVKSMAWDHCCTSGVAKLYGDECPFEVTEFLRVCM